MAFLPYYPLPNGGAHIKWFATTRVVSIFYPLSSVLKSLRRFLPWCASHTSLPAKLPPIVFTSGGFGSDVDIEAAALIDMWQKNLGVTIQVQNLEPSKYAEPWPLCQCRVGCAA
jgi:hypothetical protein